MASGGATAPRAGILASKVELTISCNKLMDMDVFSKSDPLCVLYINTSGSHWYEVSIRSWGLGENLILTGCIRISPFDTDVLLT